MVTALLTKLDLTCGTLINKHVEDTTKACTSHARVQALQSKKVAKKRRKLELLQPNSVELKKRAPRTL